MTEQEKPQLTYAYFSRRGQAFFIDILICSPLAAIVADAIPSSTIPPSQIYFVVLACYFIGLTSCRFNSTLGMRISGLRVIRIDGENQHIWQAVLHIASKFATLYAITIITIAHASVKNEDLAIAIKLIHNVLADNS